MRIAIGICYEGSPFAGWQSQPSGNTVQDHLERALGAVAGVPVRVAAAGRTDAGVHALGQVAHFDTNAERSDYSWVRGTNSNLPPEIAVQWALPVGSEFDARRSAVARSYRYLLYSHPVRPAVLSRHCGWTHARLDLAAMQHAAAHLLGEHDFSSFRSAECQADTPVRTVESLAIRIEGNYFVFDITANAFLHHMVRIVVGALMQVGRGTRTVDWVAELLAVRDRRQGPPMAAAAGLYLLAVHYPEEWKLPAFTPMMDFALVGKSEGKQ